MIFFKSDDSENIKIINIDSDERNNPTTLKILKMKLRMKVQIQITLSLQS